MHAAAISISADLTILQALQQASQFQEEFLIHESKLLPASITWEMEA
jgi:hypothetical protein